MQPAILATAPRCGARTRAGHPCRSPAVAGHQRCRMHGGRGSGAPRGNRNAWRHGTRSEGFRAIARYVRESSRFVALANTMLRLDKARRKAAEGARLAQRREARRGGSRKTKNGRSTPCTRKNGALRMPFF